MIPTEYLASPPMHPLLPVRACIFTGGRAEIVALADVPKDMLDPANGWLCYSVPFKNEAITVYARNPLSADNQAEAGRRYASDTAYRLSQLRFE